jgi:beta-alanine--pyruvate transaminase
MKHPANSLEHHWMPFSANRDFKADPRLIVQGEGVYYRDHKGRQIIDACSGLFCCAAGHGRKEIADAVAKQLMELDYVTHFQLGHPLSFEYARRLAAWTPGDLNRIFLASSGSEAVDASLKIIMAYHRARKDQARQVFVSRERAYHGVTLGGTALGGLAKNREAFSALMPSGVVHMRHTWREQDRFTRGQPEDGSDLAEDLKRFVAQYGDDAIAACYVEPIAGSTGILVPPKGYLERLRQICDDFGILLVFDEVICGFGRTGKAFAADSFGVTPDILIMAKAMTNAAQPMSAVAVREDIYETVVADAPDGSIEFFHGHTYSGHPAACAAGIATLDIFEREGLIAKASTMSGPFLDMLFSLQDLPVVVDIRGFGMIGAFDLDCGEAPGKRGADIQKTLFAAGAHVKFTGDTGILAPPLIAEQAHIDEIGAILRDVLSQI